MITDRLYNSISLGDKVLTTVSKNSKYLAVATVEEINEKENKIKISYINTPTTKWVLSTNVIKVNIKYGDILKTDTNFDCAGQVLKLGDYVVWKKYGTDGFNYNGVITKLFPKNKTVQINNNDILKFEHVFKLKVG